MILELQEIENRDRVCSPLLRQRAARVDDHWLGACKSRALCSR